MNCRRIAFNVLVQCLAPLAAVAQPGPVMSPTEIAVACAPAPRIATAASRLTIAGSTDTAPRMLFDMHDTLVVAAGAKQGVAIGQRYFVRHGSSVPAYSMSYSETPIGPHAVQTVGWIRIVAVNDTTALASVEHACQTIATGDYLEPFVAPTVPASLTDPSSLGDLDFSSPGRVLVADEDRGSAATGEFVVIDHGTTAGASAGARLGIYRDLRTRNLPLARIGDAVIVASGPDVAVARIVRARDAVFAGDYLVPEKK